MRARTPIVSIGRKSPVMGIPDSITSCLTMPTSLAASVMAEAGRPPRPAPPPRRPPWPPPLLLSRDTFDPADAAFAWFASDLHATAPARIAIATRFLFITRRSVIGASGTRRRRGEWNRTAERTRQLGGGEEDVEGRTRFRGFGGEQRELRVGHLELCAQTALESQRGEVERFFCVGHILPASVEHGARAIDLGAGACDLEAHRFTLQPQLRLGELQLRSREIDVRLRAHAVEQRETEGRRDRAIGEPAA